MKIKKILSWFEATVPAVVVKLNEILVGTVKYGNWESLVHSLIDFLNTFTQRLYVAMMTQCIIMYHLHNDGDLLCRFYNLRQWKHLNVKQKRPQDWALGDATCTFASSDVKLHEDAFQSHLEASSRTRLMVNSLLPMICWTKKVG